MERGATPHELYTEVFGSTGDRIAAIRAIRIRFGLDLPQAKEVMLQAEGIASSLDEHQERLADALQQYVDSQSGARGTDPEQPID